MKIYPAIAIIEFTDIITGMKSTDLMLKKSPVSMLKAGTISGGHYITLLGGSVAAVEEAFNEGLSNAHSKIADSVFIPDISEKTFDAIMGRRLSVSEESITIIETKKLATLVGAVDKAVKATEIEIIYLRMGDSLGGRAYAIISGKLEQIEVASEIVTSIKGIQSTIIPQIDKDYAKHIEAGTRFNLHENQILEGGE